MAAIISDHPLEIYRCDVPTGKTAETKFIFPELGQIDASAPREERLEKLAQLITDPRDGRLARTVVNRLWQRMLGRGIVHPVDSMDATPWSSDLLDYLACQLIDDHYDLKKLLREIATSQIYQARCVEPVDNGTPHLAPRRTFSTASPGGPGPLPQGEREISFRGPVARRMTAEQFLDAVWRITNIVAIKERRRRSPKGPMRHSSIARNEPIRVSLMKSDLLMRSLGRPNRDQVVTTRPESLSTLQALDLTNGPAMSALMASGAAKWRADHPNQISRRNDRGTVSRRAVPYADRC